MSYIYQKSIITKCILFSNTDGYLQEVIIILKIEQVPTNEKDISVGL